METKLSAHKAKKVLDTYQQASSKTEVDPSWTKYLLVTHPVEFITTIGRVSGRVIANVAPFATCLDTSYEPPYVTFSAALRQHSIGGQIQSKGKMNTYLNIRQNGLFIVNVPRISLLDVMDIIAYPYSRKGLEDKLEKAGLTKLRPFVLSRKHEIYPPLIGECLAHLECEVVDIHRPAESDHYNITGRVVGASYDESLGDEIDEIRVNLAKFIFHHFGANSENPKIRNIGTIYPTKREAITFKIEEKVSVRG
ncbi:flavin reductase family protein [Candidatus Woesearchaeota archaeon]|nr:flavin reductase family protein [Candidatus Woesearchaeota archaeon]